MKKLLFILVLVLVAIIVTLCTKKGDTTYNQLVLSGPIIKSDSLETLDSLLVNNQNYIEIINISYEIIDAMVQSNMSYSQFKDLAINEQYDSIMIMIGFTQSEIEYYDTALTYYGHLLSNDFDITPDTSNCGFCGMTPEERCESVGGIFDSNFSEENLNNFITWSLTESQGGDCHYVSFVMCRAGCVALLGEFPPLCCLCIWACACEYCPSEVIGCEYLQISD